MASISPNTAVSLDQCIRRSVAGDLKAFTPIVERCEPMVRAVLAAMVPDPEVVPDLTQEVFIIVHRQLRQYRPGTNFPAWIKAIARNVAQNERRRWYRRQDLQQRHQAETEVRIGEQIDAFVDGLPEETLEALRACVESLGGRTRSLVDGYYFAGCSIQRVADALKLTAGAAKVALHRARRAVGKCLRRKGTA